ncbi:SH3 domain-containing protein [Cellulophaga omnivescoria]|uniref:SH3 domain-containing protein n=1 Tax=Cellulophaga omnivescoria TaxID=1888890 RepID=UPI0022F0C36A|nr:SH3 domain-containing protein [Cellulophaga omnivescoria]WBU87912.1 SH3 domain-containing protein [Cellulophaga omnivescoria]
MKKVIYLLLIISTNIFAQEHIVTAKSGLSIRREPSIESDRIGKLNYGQTVDVLKETIESFQVIDNNETISGYWVKIKVDNSNYGYIFNGYLKFKKDYTDYTVAKQFLNAHVRGSILEKRFLTTKNFKEICNKTSEQDFYYEPETGYKIALDADLILDAQDYPDDGFKISSFDSESGYVILEGIGWESFKVTVKVVNENGIFLVDGSGIINIPPDKRPKR